MDKATYEHIKAAVEFGDVYFIGDDGETRNVRSVYVDADGQIWFASDDANLVQKR